MVALLTLSQMQLIVLQLKERSDIAARQKARINLERSASHLLAKGVVSPLAACEGKYDYGMKSSMGCHFLYKKETYVYLWEDLGVMPCLDIRGVDKKIYSAQQGVLTVKAMSNHTTWMEMRIVTQARHVPCEKSVYRWTKPGIVSLRYDVS